MTRASLILVARSSANYLAHYEFLPSSCGRRNGQMPRPSWRPLFVREHGRPADGGRASSRSGAPNVSTSLHLKPTLARLALNRIELVHGSWALQRASFEAEKAGPQLDILQAELEQHNYARKFSLSLSLARSL